MCGLSVLFFFVLSSSFSLFLVPSWGLCSCLSVFPSFCLSSSRPLARRALCGGGGGGFLVCFSLFRSFSFSPFAVGTCFFFSLVFFLCASLLLPPPCAALLLLLLCCLGVLGFHLLHRASCYPTHSNNLLDADSYCYKMLKNPKHDTQIQNRFGGLSPRLLGRQPVNKFPLPSLLSTLSPLFFRVSLSQLFASFSFRPMGRHCTYHCLIEHEHTLATLRQK